MYRKYRRLESIFQHTAQYMATLCLFWFSCICFGAVRVYCVCYVPVLFVIYYWELQIIRLD